VARERLSPRTVERVVLDSSLGERLDVDPVRPFGTDRDLIGRDPHLEEVADRGETESRQELGRALVGRPVGGRQLPRALGSKLARASFAERKECGADPRSGCRRVRTSVDAKLFVTRGPDAGEAHDLVLHQREASIDGGIRPIVVKLRSGLGGRRAGDSLIRQRARVEEVREPIGVGIRRGTEYHLFLHRRVPFVVGLPGRASATSVVSPRVREVA
jgi:hypothetical protein